MLVRASALCALAALSSGCASLPDVELKYYLPDWKASIVATRTVTCAKDTDPKKPWHTPSYGPVTSKAEPIYFADTGASAGVAIKDLQRWYATQSLTFNLTADGRLKGVNSSATGVGDEVIKSVVALGGMAMNRAAAAAEAEAARTRQTPDPICALVQKHAAEGSASVAISFRASVSADKCGAEVELKPDKPFGGVNGTAGNVLPSLRAKLVCSPLVGSGKNAEKPPVPVLTLREVALATVSVHEGEVSLETHAFTVPMKKEVRYLPIPKAAFFGGTQFELELADSGAITKITYGRTSGAAGSASAIGELAKLRSTNETRAERLKAEADLIAAQARLDKCRGAPDKCE